MKVQCPSCSTVYRLPDDRVPAGSETFRVRCKNCGEVIHVSVDSASVEEKVTDSPAVWYVAVGNERQGPLTASAILGRIAEQELGRENFVWCKGFDGWVRLADVAEFAGAVAGDDAPTELMGFDDVGGRTSAGVTQSAPVATGGESESHDDMVWQRKETSVLFSLDDYKVKKRTQSQPSLAGSESIVQIQPIDSAVKGVAPEPAAGVISLDENEVLQLAESLARRKKMRNSLIFSVVGIGVLVLAGGLVLFAVRMMDTAGRVAPGQIPAPVAQIPAPVAQAPAQAVQHPAPVPAPAPEQVVQSPAPAQANVVNDGSGAKPSADQVAVVTEPAKPVEPKSRKDDSGDSRRKTSKSEPKSATKPVAKNEPKPAQQDEPKPEPKPEPKAKPATNDANALLAQLHAGRKAAVDNKPSEAEAENLPAQLSGGQIQSVLRKKAGAIAGCVKNKNMTLPITISTKIVISGTGRVVSATAANGGDAKACIEATLRGSIFPKFKGADMSAPYPYTVR